MMKSPFLLMLSLAVFLASACNTENDANDKKPRLLITTDIGGDPDDQQSLVRLLVHSNEFDIEGFVTSASGTPGELDTSVVKPYLVHEQIDAYEKVYQNLLLHDSTFPAPSALRSVVKSGNPHRGQKHIGAGHTTEGSAWIARQLLKNDPRPLYISIWGGQTDVAQALWMLKDSLTNKRFSEVTEKLIIYDIMDQDGLYTMIRDSFPGIFYIRNKSPKGVDKREAVFRGMYLGGNMDNTSREWIYENVKTGHGPLGAFYPDKTWTAPNPHGALKEGDTPSWFYFLNSGLQDPGHPEWGGWGGRFEKAAGRYYRDATDQADTVSDARLTVWRWREAFQNQFAARMDWCINSYEEANHSPLAALNGDKTSKILKIAASPGEQISVDASGSSDPDGDELKYKWWVYQEPSGTDFFPQIGTPDQSQTSVIIPENAGNGDIHLILEVTDNGSPSLSAYRRVIINIVPK